MLYKWCLYNAVGESRLQLKNRPVDGFQYVYTLQNRFLLQHNRGATRESGTVFTKVKTDCLKGNPRVAFAIKKPSSGRFFNMVPLTGVEPVRIISPRDFKMLTHLGILRICEVSKVRFFPL